MVFNFAAFDQGVQQSKDEFRKRRAENAALYADFIKSNPDASVDERSTFAENLAGNSNFLKNALPTRSMMEKNVAIRNQQKAAAAAARKQAALKQNIALAGQLAGVYGSAYVSGGEEQALSAIKDLAGDVLPEAALPLVQQFGKEKARQIVNERMQPKFDLWRTAGANKADIAAWENSVSEGARDLLTPWIQQANATLSGLQQADYQKATAAATSVVNSGDEIKVNNFADPKNLAALYPHLGDRAQEVIEATQQGYAGFKQQRQNRINAAVETSVEQSGAKLASGEITDVQVAVDLINAKGRELDPNFELGADKIAILEKSNQQFLHNSNELANNEENAKLAQEALEMGQGQFDLPFGDSDAMKDIQSTVEMFAEGVATEDRDAKALTSDALSTVQKFSSTYNIPINDEAMVVGLSRVALQNASETGTTVAQVPDSLLRAEADRIMQNRNDPQAQAYKAALATFGVTSMNELSDAGQLGSFPDAYDAAIQDVVNKSKDVYEAGVYTPEHIQKLVEEDTQAASEAARQITQGGADGLSVMENAQRIIDMETSSGSLREIVDGAYDNDQAIAKQLQQLEQEMLKLQDRKRRALARIEAPEFQSTRMMGARQNVYTAIPALDQQMTAMSALYDSLVTRRQQLGNKMQGVIAHGVEPSYQTLDAIADAIGAFAIQGSTPQQQMQIAEDYIDQAIGNREDINPAIYKRILTHLVETNLEIATETPSEIQTLIDKLNEGNFSPEQVSPAAVEPGPTSNTSFDSFGQPVESNPLFTLDGIRKLLEPDAENPNPLPNIYNPMRITVDGS